VWARSFSCRSWCESHAHDLERHFDASGAVTITAGLMLFVYALTRGPQIGWSTGEVIGSFAGFAILTAAFLGVELRSRSPRVPLGFLRRRTLAGANGIGLILGTMVFGMFYLLSLYMQQVLGFSPIKTGVGYLAVALTAVVASGVAQGLVTRIGVRPALAAGMLLLGGGLVYLTQISVNGTYFGDLFIGFLLIGVGLGFAFVPVSIAALAGVTPREASLASGLINTTQQIGGALGLAVLTTVSTTRTNHLLDAGSARATPLTHGFTLAFWVAAGFAVAALATTLLVLRRDDLRPVSAEPVAEAA
jgi:predicted MFS family arabinose efflux permease